MRTGQNKYDTEGKLKNGVFKEHYKEGELACVGEYRDGEKVGIWKYYLRNGQLRAVGKFAGGKMTGAWEWYRENGKLMQTGSFVEERKSGVWKRYHPNGALLDEGQFADNKKVGEWRVYDPKGKLLKRPPGTNPCHKLDPPRSPNTQPLDEVMLAQYIDMALELARYEIIEGEGTYWGEIPGFQGVWATHETLAGCQRELRETLSDWIALRLRLNLETPELGRLNLNDIGAPSDA